MTQEEKVRAYDKAFGRAKALYSKGAPDSLCLEEMFPELKESEEEKIRQKLLFLCYAWRNNEQVEIPSKEEADETIAWLEKQGEEAIKKALRLEYEKGRADAIAEMQGEQKHWDSVEPVSEEDKLYLMPDEQKSADSYCQENCKGFQETGKCFADGSCEAKREAESTDKVEPKFHEGEWVVNKLGSI